MLDGARGVVHQHANDTCIRTTEHVVNLVERSEVSAVVANDQQDGIHPDRQRKTIADSEQWSGFQYNEIKVRLPSLERKTESPRRKTLGGRHGLRSRREKVKRFDLIEGLTVNLGERCAEQMLAQAAVILDAELAVKAWLAEVSIDHQDPEAGLGESDGVVCGCFIDTLARQGTGYEQSPDSMLVGR